MHAGQADAVTRYTQKVSTQASRNRQSTNTSEIYDLAIVGSGLVGSACALAGAQCGLRVALIGPGEPEAASQEPWDRRVFAISPASQAFLSRLRVWDQLPPERIGPVHQMHIHSGKAGEPDLSFGAYEAKVESLAWIVEERELAKAFSAGLAFQASVDRMTFSVESVDAPNGVVRGANSLEQCKAHLIVAADGANSVVRSSAGIAASIQTFEQCGVVANFETAHLIGNQAFQWFTNEGVVALLPLSGNVFSLVWSAPEALAAELVLAGPLALASRIETIVGPRFGSLKPLGGVSSFPLKRLVTTSTIGPGIVLIGDAAHVIHPLAGQGLNLGLQDAEALIAAIAARESFRGCGDPRVLRRYERNRKEAVWSMGQVTDGLHRMFRTSDPVVGSVRQLGLQAVQRLTPLKNALIRRAIR